MKKTPTHYYCCCTNSCQPKNKLQTEFLELLQSIDAELYSTDYLNDLKAYILEKAKELNKKHSRCTSLNLFFEQYNTNNHYLVGFETAQFHLKAAYFIECNPKL